MDDSHQRIRFFPFLADLRSYSWATARADALAGLTVAVFAVPQVMAYAMLAGLPPSHGLYAAMVMALVAALFGGFTVMNSGPTNSVALLTAGAIAVVSGQLDPTTVMFHLTLLVGAFCTLLALFRMGWLLRFVPESALVGFTTGAAFLIATGQLHHLFGINGARSHLFLPRIAEVATHLQDANGWALGIGLGTLAVMFGLDRYSKRWPVALAAIALATLAGSVAPSLRLVRDIAPVLAHLPRPAILALDFDLFRALAPTALAIAAIGLIEAVSIGEVLAMKRRRHLDVNQEFFGQGLSQIAAAFFLGFPGSGSFSRSALADQAGGQTRFTNVIFSFCLALAVLSLPSWLNRIPVCALAGLLIYIGIKLIDVRRIRRILDTSRADTAVMVVTALVTVFVHIEYGIFAGILTAMAVFLNRASQPKIFEMVPLAPGRFDEVPYASGHIHGPGAVVAVSIHGELFFGMAQQLREALIAIARDQQPRFVILRLRHAYSIDYSCWSAIFEFADGFQRTGGVIYIAGAGPEVARIVRDAGMEHLIPPQNILPATEKPFESFERAIALVLPQVANDPRRRPGWIMDRLSI